MSASGAAARARRAAPFRHECREGSLATRAGRCLKVGETLTTKRCLPCFSLFTPSALRAVVRVASIRSTTKTPHTRTTTRATSRRATKLRKPHGGTLGRKLVRQEHRAYLDHPHTPRAHGRARAPISRARARVACAPPASRNARALRTNAPRARAGDPPARPRHAPRQN